MSPERILRPPEDVPPVCWPTDRGRKSQGRGEALPPPPTSRSHHLCHARRVSNRNPVRCATHHQLWEYLYRNISVHSSNQRLRLSSISPGSMLIGSSGITVWRRNSPGRPASSLAGKTNMF